MGTDQPHTTDESTSSDGPAANGFEPKVPSACEQTGSPTTVAFQTGEPTITSHGNRRLPTSLGRYVVQRKVAEGGQGTVLIGEDIELHRIVAIKVPHEDRMCYPGATDQFLEEARHLAQMRHPGIVTVHDVGVQDGMCYIVTDHVDGMSLADWLRTSRATWQESTRIVSAIADALAYAHAHRIVHRDIKPSNIMLDKKHWPILVDFGLAVSEKESSRAVPGRIFGTPGYMSPEQARGEGHRIDGRTDVYSLGVVLYRMLCGRLPFAATSDTELRREVLEDEPQPPRQIDHTIPVELERICLKALAKRIADRYSTASDMAEELRQVGVSERPTARTSVTPLPQTPQPPHTPSAIDSRPLRVVPKGLRAFGPEDMDFYLELLPGPRNRDGLPDSIRFWKTRIEENGAEPSFCVGLMYGPSGCGKSSLVRAGLMPRLSEGVLPVYVESTRDDTEQRLVRALGRVCPRLQPAQELSELVASVRIAHGVGAGRRLLVILDQFEQWLHAHGSDMEKSELVNALRQADGRAVQFLLLVRDDFWLAVTRLFENLEIPLDRDRNTRLVDLFDVSHARRVLMAFGHAFGQLPESPRDLTIQEKGFLDRAVSELSQDRRVVPVHISLFAELMKDRGWSTSTLDQVGGTHGVGVTFLSETFSTRAAVPEHRAMERPARALLQALLPEGGADIKGHMRSRADLADACGLPESSPRFNRLVQILDQELHVITPTESEGIADGPARTAYAETKNLKDPNDDPDKQRVAGAPVAGVSGAMYQLTHDYLVPPLRQWLNLERRRTRRGRAELALEERTAQMQRWPQSHYLPSPLEYVSILFGVPGRSRRPDQQQLMTRASRYYGLRWGGALVALLVVAIFVQQYIASVRRAAAMREVEAQRLEASAAVVQAVGSVPSELTKRVAEIRRTPQTMQELREILQNDNSGRRERLHAAFCLIHIGGNREPDAVAYVLSAIPWADADECTNFVTFLQPIADAVRDATLDRCRDTGASPDIKARYATILLQLGDWRGAKYVLKLQADPSNRTEFIHNVFPKWHARLNLLNDVLSQNDLMQDDEDTAAIRSGLCSAIALLPATELGDQDFVLGLLTRLSLQAPDGGTRSAAAYGLRQFGASAPLPDRTQGPAPRRHWFVNSLNMTMVEIPAGTLTIGSGDSRCEIVIERPFLMQDREVSIALFRQFYAEFERTHPDDAHVDAYRWNGPDLRFTPRQYPEQGPAQNMTWFCAIQFCNWLSRIEGREPCYRPTGGKEKITLPSGSEVECDIWESVPTANGYRLPTGDEWQYACAARSSAAYCFGDSPDLLKQYALGQAMVMEDGARRLPNAWGLFDMHGNAAEWCSDIRAGNPALRTNAEANLHMPPQWSTTTYLAAKNAASAWGSLGFRVTCSAD